MVRALTLHLSSHDIKPEEALDVLRELKTSLEMGGVAVWTLRVSLNEDHKWRGRDILCSSDVLVAAYHRYASEVRTEDLVRYLTSCGNGYAALVASGEDLERLAQLYLELSRYLPEDYFTKLGVSYGGYVETPYFPVSAALRDVVTVGYRYVDLFLSTEPSKWYEAVVNYVTKVGGLLGDKLDEFGLELYHDVSISPWMEESSVEVLEKLGAAFPDVGTLSAVYRVNDVLRKITESVRSTGFNELMLPVAEDNRLRDLARSGVLRVRDLISLSTACVAGLDMVAVPRNRDYMKRVFDDTFTSFTIKKRPYGVRIIPTDKESVILRRFGELPTLR